MIAAINRLLGLLIGAAFVATGFIGAVNGVSTWTHSGFVWIPGRDWLADFRSTPWSATIVVATSVGVAIFGLALLILESWPQPGRLVPYRTEATGDWVLVRRSAEAHLRRRLSAQVLTSGLSVRLRASSSRWTLDVNARGTPSSRPALEMAARAELVALHAPAASRVQVRRAGAETAPVAEVVPEVPSP